MSQVSNNIYRNFGNIIIKESKSNSLSPETIKLKRIGNYILSNTIGTGTFSKVKLGIHLPTKEKVAIKILDKDKIRDESDIERISREIHILKNLRHKNIVQLYETITSENHIYIIMEYVDGKDLFQYIYSLKRLNEIKASFLFRQLISTLEYIHKLGIVHRDIKPENILLTKDHKTVKLVDFGLSNSYQHGNLIKTACGSPCYAAPEMISGKKYNGLYSDLWACGVVLYCMLCGKLPFDDEKIDVLYKKIKSGNYIIPNFLSDIAQDVIRKILTVNPEKRIKLKDLKLHPFFNLDKSTLDIGVFIGVDDVFIDYDVIKEMKEKFYADKDYITKEYICELISHNYYNSITAIYYLLIKNKEEKKKIEKEKSEKEKNESERKKGNIFLNNVKKLTFENSRNYNNQNGNNDSINLNNSNNRYNVVVINNFLGETKENNNSISPKNIIKKLNENNDSQNKTTKININDFISNHMKKHNSRNLSSLISQKNKTVSLGTPIMNNTLINNTTNGEKTLNIYKVGINNNAKKYLFNSPNSSEKNLKLVLKNNKKKYKPVTSNLSRNIKTINQAKTQIKNEGKSKRDNLTKYVNKLYIKQLFENESSFNNESNINNGSNNINNISLNLTNYTSNTKKKIFNMKSNSLNKRPLKTTQNTKHHSKNYSNISELENSQNKNYLKCIPKNNNIEFKKLNQFFKNKFSLKTQNNSKEKGNILKYNNLKTSSPNKEIEKKLIKRNKNSDNNNNNKTIMIELKFQNQQNGKKNNSLNQKINNKKNIFTNLNGFGNVNFNNIIRKNISKDKKQILNLKNFSINQPKQFKFHRAITNHNSKDKPNPVSNKSSSFNKNNNTNSLLKKIPKKNLSIKI